MTNGIVLNFHRELDAELFEKVIIALKDNYKIVSLPEFEYLLSNKKKLTNICHLTFDDGEISFYNVVFPILVRHSVPVSLFVSPLIIKSQQNYWFQQIEEYANDVFKDHIAEHLNVPIEQVKNLSILSMLKCLDINTILRIISNFEMKGLGSNRIRYNMNLAQILEVENSGLITIGAHTLNHPILKNENDYSSSYEISESIIQLENLVKHRINYFAFPNGVENLDFSNREIEYLKNMKQTIAFTTEFDNLSKLTSFYKIPRMAFPSMLGLAPNHPLVLFRLRVGKSWPSFRRNPPSEIDMRKNFMQILDRNGA